MFCMMEDCGNAKVVTFVVEDEVNGVEVALSMPAFDVSSTTIP